MILLPLFSLAFADDAPTALMVAVVVVFWKFSIVFSDEFFEKGTIDRGGRERER